MDELATGVWQLRGRPRHLFNVYLVGDVVIDAAIRASRGRILRQLDGRRIAPAATSPSGASPTGC